ncbi:dense granule protein GRA2 [Toxoplasma gondii GAB2-2007-GAL-DOM2]|uniref:Dense granule protein 2 n=6 Tax=Toxoplasma gondii TaxID=5811 RepID=GRA2_TOXGO|nr:RecName: Full=Dense granule protein 2; Short=Protein GRA 2; AltName: Full=28 kDa antigen; AltName: Full=GP28.5; Flags: Precursor [Toxoplasma gondii]EPR62387.1 dense granule protein GRA2 [Toxoplasma gondii GT1]KFG45139.1 dense granule protein GRA2 [Toxoplasma gondii GAB2-2007-GAL-DOM2]KFG52011.1 dense granule protein GRA2 [Toxoplasma gondii FOU]PUA91014.1 dense granule protein GRA2 [Toxoplasma gondii TgCATBr9]RQX74377.1 dense granule protein GRA2 [Toxoplasma gondii CAST]
MFAVKHCLLVVAVGALVNVSVRAAEFSGVVNQGPVDVPFSGKPLDERAVGGKGEHTPPLPDERQQEPEEPVSQRASRVAEQLFRKFLKFAENVGHHSEKAFKKAKVVAEKGFTAAKTHTVRGFKVAKEAAGRGMVTVGKKLANVESDRSTTTTQAPDSPNGLAETEVPVEPQQRAAHVPVPDFSQ